MRLLAALLLVLGSASIYPATVRTAPAAGRTVDITATDDMKYSVTAIAAKPGEKLRIRITAKGVVPKIAMAHNVVILKIGTDIQKFLQDGAPHRDTDFIPPAMTGAVIAKTPFVGPGETAEVMVTVPARPGAYPYICTFSGHYQAGMKGTLVVK